LGDEINLNKLNINLSIIKNYIIIKIKDKYQNHFFFVPFFLIYSFVGVIELFTIVGFPKNDYNLG